MLLSEAEVLEDREFSLDEYVDFVRANVDVTDFESMCASSWSLKALANNRSFLLNAYNDELEAILSGTSINTLTPQSIVLAYGKNFYLRANIWLPATGIAAVEDREKKLNSYDVAHDHNFSFVTVGYFGAGYETDIYTYDDEKIIGLSGEKVMLNYSGRYTLRPGTLMAYKAGYHVHIQFPPPDITVSLNLMSSAGIGTRQQFAFDLEAQQIAGGLTDTTGTRLFLISVLPELLSSDTPRSTSAEETVELLGHLASRYQCIRTRSQALRALRRIDDSEYERVVRRSDRETIRLSELDLCHAGQARQIDIL
jgi:hypothetical protein